MSFLGKIFFRDGHRGQLDAAFDIGTSGVRGTLFSHKDGVIEFKRVAHVALERGEAADSFVIEGGEVERILQSFLRAHPDFSSLAHGYVGLGGEVLRPSTFRAEFLRESPSEKIDEAELKNFLEKTERESREHILERMTKPRGEESAMQLVTSRLEEILIDGYAVHDPVGLAGREIKITLFNVYAEPTHLAFLQGLKNILGAKVLVPWLLPYAVCRALGESPPGSKPLSAILIDIGQTTTSVSVLVEGRFVGSRTFPFGGGIFTASLASHLNLGYREAEDVKARYVTGTLSKAVSRKISAILNRGTAVWVSGVEMALEEFAHALELFPSLFLLYGGSAQLQDLGTALAETGRFAAFPFLEKRTSRVLGTADLPFLKQGVPSPGLGVGETGATDISVLCLARAASSARAANDPLAKLTRRAVKLAYS